MAIAGHVSIVGAGPGDPGLLTRRAVARLRNADLVLYDALVDRRVLALARRAHCFFVGKRSGHHALAQQDIHAIMIRAARRGRRVVRLKGGDPFVFGRGGEEAHALQTAGVPFDVVPGVTSALSAPALAGIPITHRGLASACLIVSGHEREAFANVVGGLPSSGLTLVILMGGEHRAEIASVLLERGWRATTPAAIVSSGSLPQQEVWRGNVDTLARGCASFVGDGPSLIVVGDVAALALVDLPAEEIPA